MNGTVESLTPDWRGATLLTAVGSVLTVDDVADFDEEGGWLTIADAAPLEYVAVDEDADTVTLAGMAGTVEAGDPVVIWDPTVPPTGAKVVEYLASVMTDRGPVDAVIPHEKIPLAGVDTLVGASVSLTEDDYGTPYVDQVFGREPIIDGASVDLSTADVSVLPPPPPLQTFSADPPSTTTGFDEDHAWWQVDADGNVLGFWRLVAGVWTAQTITTIEALQANNVLVTALNGTQITGATVQTRPEVDRGIKLLAGEDDDGNPTDAFYVFDNSGVPFLKAVPSEGMAVIAGEVKATTETVTDGASLGGITEITRAADGSAGAVRLTGYTTAPKSAPVVTTGYDTVQFTDDGDWDYRRGWATDGTYWYTARNHAKGGFYVEKWNAAGTLASTSAFTSSDTAYGCVVHGGKIYVLRWLGGAATPTVSRYDAATFASELSADWQHFDFTGWEPTIGVDPATGELLLAQARQASSDKVRVRRYTMPATSGLNLVLVGTFIDSNFAYVYDLSGVTYGDHDLGFPTYVFTAPTTGGFRVIDGAGTEAPFDNWQSGMPGKVGFTYAGGVFVSMDTTGLMRTYTGQDKGVAIGDASLTKWVSNDLSTATLHTDQSPRAKITVPKRSKLNVTTSAINTGGANAPDRVRIFVGQGATDPGRTAMWKQTDPGVGVTTSSYSSLATSGTNPVATNGFAAAAGTVQRVELADGTVFVDGVGNGSVGTGTFRDSVDARFLTLPMIGLRSTGTAQSIANGAWTKVDLTGTLDHNVGDITVSASVATITTAGIYHASAGLVFASSNNTTERSMMLEWWTGTDPGVGLGNKVIREGMSGSGVSLNPALTGSTDMSFAAGTKIRLCALQSSGAALNVANNIMPSYYNLRRVG